MRPSSCRAASVGTAVLIFHNGEAYKLSGSNQEVKVTGVQTERGIVILEEVEMEDMALVTPPPRLQKTEFQTSGGSTCSPKNSAWTPPCDFCIQTGPIECISFIFKVVTLGDM